MKILAAYIFPFHRLSSIFICSVGEETESIAILFLVQKFIKGAVVREETVKGYYPSLLLIRAVLSCPWLPMHQARGLSHLPGPQSVHRGCAT